jgi:excisionase family DNA binding protein
MLDYSSDERFLPIKEAATILGVHHETLRRWVSNGIVPAYGRRGFYRVRISEVLPPIPVAPCLSKLGKDAHESVQRNGRESGAHRPNLTG